MIMYDIYLRNLLGGALYYSSFDRMNKIEFTFEILTFEMEPKNVIVYTEICSLKFSWFGNLNGIK